MIIIIGASSFIGVYTAAEFINHGQKIVVTARNNRFKEHYEAIGVPFINLDLTNHEDFNRLPIDDVDGVILLAGLLPANTLANLSTEENAADYFRVNVLGTINVLEYCRRNKINRVISACSYADVSKSWTSTRAITEDEPRNFAFTGDHSAYIISKNAANDILEYYNQQHEMKNASFRFPPVYGAGPHGSLYVNGKRYKSGLQTFMENAMQGKELCVYGDKNLSRDVVYVKDVARAYYQAIFSNKTYGLYNISSGHGVTLDEQAHVIADIFHTPGKPFSRVTYRPEIINNTPSFLFSIEKAKRDFGYEPIFDDFRVMMKDMKRDFDNKLYQDLFNY